MLFYLHPVCFTKINSSNGFTLLSQFEKARNTNFYRTGATLTNTVGISGGSDRGTYRLSVSDMRNRGIVPNASFNRQTVNLLVNFKVTSKLTVETKINYIRQDESNPPETGGLSTSPAAAINRLPLFLILD